MREVGVGRAEVEIDDYPLHVGQVLLEEVSLEAVQLFEVPAQLRDALRVERRTGAALQLADVGVDGADRHQTGQ